MVQIQEHKVLFAKRTRTLHIPKTCSLRAEEEDDAVLFLDRFVDNSPLRFPHAKRPTMKANRKLYVFNQ